MYEQARIFLQDPSVREASREKKVSFLKEKGLQGDEIEELLDTASPEPVSSVEKESSLKTLHDSSAPSSSASSASPSPQAQAQSAAQPIGDVPPVITYPEFLLRPTKPPPLITLERLSYSLYAVAGISALSYGTSKYLIQPMLQSLASARHDLASTALHNLERLNEKLEGKVSHIPAMPQSVAFKAQERKWGRNLPIHADKNDDDDGRSRTSTLDSDPPTELFHRDVATQTSPQPSRSPSPTRSSSTPIPRPAERRDATSTQSAHLTSLSGTLSSLLASTESSTSKAAHSTLLDSISACQAYLDRLQLGTSAHGAGDHHPTLVVYGRSSPTAGPAASDKRGRAEGDAAEQDEAARFRQDIRSIKGALLSVRNFPALKSPAALPLDAPASLTPIPP